MTLVVLHQPINQIFIESLNCNVFIRSNSKSWIHKTWIYSHSKMNKFIFLRSFSFFDKIHIFWEGHKSLQNLQCIFDCYYILRTNLGWRFRKYWIVTKRSNLSFPILSLITETGKLYWFYWNSDDGHNSKGSNSFDQNSRL